MVASSGSVDPFTKVENRNGTCTLRAALLYFRLLRVKCKGALAPLPECPIKPIVRGGKKEEGEGGMVAPICGQSGRDKGASVRVGVGPEESPS
ncbi:hypothetical protein CRG98_031722 [Punica granatum]|uniref:Uncharacterized protein n=1 Tax=Punica granatum TaxID=22663 RepID=A0A2I0IVC0_PUNGR|nr:hypothetical protein CRG98_031722 [Punica granatum]